MPEKDNNPDEIVFDSDMDLDSLVSELSPPQTSSGSDTGASQTEAIPGDIEMIDLDAEPVSSVTASGDDPEMVNLEDGKTPAPPAPDEDDIELIEVDEEAIPASEAPLPEWLGDDLPQRPLIERDGLGVDLSGGDNETPELDLRHEFQRETKPDPSYVREDLQDEDDKAVLICHECGTRNEFSRTLCMNCGQKLRIPTLD